MRTESLEFIPDVRVDASYIGAMPGIVSELAVPLVGTHTKALLNIETVGAQLPPGSVHAFAPLIAALMPVTDALNGSRRLDLAALARLTVYASSLRSVAALSEFATRTLGRLLDLETVQLNLGPTGGGTAASFWRRPESGLLPIAGNAVAAAAARSTLNEYTWSVLDAADLGIAAPGEAGRWLLWLPLRVGSTPIGTLVGRSNEPISLEHEQLEAATLFAQHTAALIDIAQALRREQRAAVTDSLTGLLNRRGFDDRLQEEIARAQRSSTPLAVVLADFDDLKRINDHLGHEGGDLVLQGFARLLRKRKRASDVAGRVGGDEFGLLLPDADASTAADVAERVRRAVPDMGPAPGGTTASFGIAVYPDDGDTSAALLRAADRALYRAKDGGKDRVAGALGAATA